MSSTPFLDRAATFVSASCIVHCLALPIVAVSSPFVAALAEAEWVHWVLTFLAFLASGSVVATSIDARTPSFVIPAGLGLMLLAFSIFAESFGIDETVPTVIGGCFLAGAHLYRLFKTN